MKERFLDVIKWGLILVIAGAVFYKMFTLIYPNMYPKYQFFMEDEGLQWYRCNEITGKVEQWQGPDINIEYGEWKTLRPLTEKERLKRLRAEREQKAIDLMDSFWGRGRPISELEENYRNDLIKEERERVRLQETLLMMDRVDDELAAKRKELKKSGSIQRDNQ